MLTLRQAQRLPVLLPVLKWWRHPKLLSVVNAPRDLVSEDHSVNVHRDGHSGACHEVVAHRANAEIVLATCTRHQSFLGSTREMATTRVQQLPVSTAPAVAVRVEVVQGVLALWHCHGVGLINAVVVSPELSATINVPRDLRAVDQSHDAHSHAGLGNEFDTASVTQNERLFASVAHNRALTRPPSNDRIALEELPVATTPPSAGSKESKCVLACR